MRQMKIYLASSIVAYLLSITTLVSATPLPAAKGPAPSVIGAGTDTSNLVPISVPKSEGEGRGVDADQGPSTSSQQQAVQKVADIKFPEGKPQDWTNKEMIHLVRTFKPNVDWTDGAWTIEMLRANAEYISGMKPVKLQARKDQEDWSKEALEKMDKRNLITVIQKMWAAVIENRQKLKQRYHDDKLEGSEKDERKKKKEAEKAENREKRVAEKAAIEAIKSEENAKEREKRKADRKAENDAKRQKKTQEAEAKRTEKEKAAKERKAEAAKEREAAKAKRDATKSKWAPGEPGYLIEATTKENPRDWDTVDYETLRGVVELLVSRDSVQAKLRDEEIFDEVIKSYDTAPKKTLVQWMDIIWPVVIQQREHSRYY